MADINTIKLKLGLDTSEATKKLKNVTKAAEKTKKPLSGIAKAFKRIVLYRGIRALLSGIGNAFKTGISNLYQFSKLTNGIFSESLDKLSGGFQYIKNSLASVLAPLIINITPALVQLTQVVGQFGNKLANTLAYLMGQPKYYKANADAIKKYSNAVKGASIGIDELNVIGETNDLSNMFEEVNVNIEAAEELINKLGIVSQSISNIVKDIKDLDLTRLLSVTTNVISIIASISGALNGNIVGTGAGGLLALFGLAQQSDITFQDVGLKMLTTGLAGAVMGAKIGGGWGALIGGAIGLVSSLVTSIISAININETTGVKTSLQSEAETILALVLELLNDNIFKPVENWVRQAIVDIGLWGSTAWNNATTWIANAFIDIYNAIGEFVINAVNFIVGKFADTMNWLPNLLGWGNLINWEALSFEKVPNLPYQNESNGNTQSSNESGSNVNVYLDGELISKSVKQHTARRGFDVQAVAI